MNRVAIIEDSEDNRVLVTALLEDRYECIEFEDGASALAGLGASEPSLILLDISLPTIDGEQVLREIRKDPELSKLPVIALTAHSMRGDRQRFLEMGFDDYISKPIVDEEAFLATVARWAGARSLPLAAAVKARLVGQYNASLPTKLEAVNQAMAALEAGDESGGTALRRMGHQLGGSGETFGWREVSVHGERVNAASPADLLVEGAALADALRRAIAEVAVADEGSST